MQLEPGAASPRMKYLQQLCLKFLYKLFCHPTLSFPLKQKLGYFNTLDSSPFLRNKVLMKTLCAWLKSALSLVLVLFILCPPCGLYIHFDTLAPLGKLVGGSVCLLHVSVEATQADPRGWTWTERREENRRLGPRSIRTENMVME